MNSVAAVAAIAPAQPSSASRRTPRGDSSDTPTTTSPASRRNTTCFMMNTSRDCRSRSATAGDAASMAT